MFGAARKCTCIRFYLVHKEWHSYTERTNYLTHCVGRDSKFTLRCLPRMLRAKDSLKVWRSKFFEIFPHIHKYKIPEPYFIKKTDENLG